MLLFPRLLYYNIYICIHMFIVVPICGNFMYSSLHVNEEFVIVAQCDGVAVWHGCDSRLCG